MTDQELVDTVLALTADARSILQKMADFGVLNQDIVFTLSNGTSTTVPSVAKQRDQITTELTSQLAKYHGDASGAPQMAITRAATGAVTGITTTHQSGWRSVFTFARSGTPARVSTITVNIYDNLDALKLGPVTRTLTYSGGRLSAVN